MILALSSMQSGNKVTEFVTTSVFMYANRPTMESLVYYSHIAVQESSQLIEEWLLAPLYSVLLVLSVIQSKNKATEFVTTSVFREQIGKQGTRSCTFAT